MTATILTVCSGNICRSPFAAALLCERLAGLDVRVESAGTIATDGLPMSSQTLIQARLAGIADLDHSARFLTERILAEADLVLAMTAEHRSAVVRLLPSLARRTFTLTEFAARVAANPESTPGTATDAKSALRDYARSLVRRPAPAAEATPDVEDPYGRLAEAYARMAEQIIPAVDAVAQAIDSQFPEEQRGTSEHLTRAFPEEPRGTSGVSKGHTRTETRH
ncbi:arsenate reductase/protein-tyrosine-phosphatase family protein [Tessaracoccus defluvii]|uniref:Low molecular weight phosphatase family protein n=1 Tax=Tessaracoccus defluvii TaxID=1285901 RepID=A0A7H0H3D1_9ACTN|nr:low molecular weight phosphatase family protein [Tessaracoccus defluvii]QNP55047.1 low molecular weight phosphatase family protein [Tessaracoccus defluvii]